MSPSLKVLMVEDEALLLMDIEAMIEDGGHHVVGEASSLAEVEALADSICPQLAFVDLHLAHDSNGIDVCNLIRRRWPEALIVFVTANVSKIPSDFSGAHGVIAKPFSHAGITTALTYLAQGVFNPPPGVPRPASLVAAPRLERRFAA